LSEAVRAFEEALAREIGPSLPLGDESHELASLWRVGGIEIATSTASIPERSLRRVWRDRESGRGVALLVVSPHPALAKVWVVGPSAQSGPPRAADVQALVRELVSIRGLSPRQAAARLAEVLERLDRISIPGVLVHGLLTDHYVERRLPPYRAELGEAVERLDGASAWRDVLVALGYELVQRPQGYLLRHGGVPIAVLHPYPDASLFGRMSQSGTLPEGILLHQCHEESAPWGILAAGTRLRLYHAGADYGAVTHRWLELDAEALEPDWKFLLSLLSPSALRPDGQLKRFLEEARDFGVDLRERIEEQIREVALPHIARGLGDWMVPHEAADLSRPDVREEIQRATLTFLFRLLFLLYAESAGYLPMHSAAYRPHAANTLAREARETGDRADPAATSFWDRLRILVNALRSGNRAWSVDAYNGSLFAPDDLPGAALLERASVTDDYVVPALEALGFDFEASDVDAGIDYAGLEIGHLGAIYEGLLALSLSQATETLAWEEERNRYVPTEEPSEKGVAAGQLFFQTEAGARKGGGVFYTRQDIVRHLVRHSVLPALEEHLATVRERATQDPKGAAKLLLNFRVLDPAMGSAHFLVDALDVIADRIETFLAEVPLPGIREALAQLRSQTGETPEVVEDGQLLRRLVLKHCLYGVDLSEMAVEIGRISLWLASFVPGLALTYLGHNLQQGDSLIGVASLEAVRATNPLFLQPQAPVPQALHRAAELAKELAELQDRTPGEVDGSRLLVGQLEQVQEGAHRVFDCWTAKPFGVDGARELVAAGVAENVISGSMDKQTAQLAADAQSAAKDLKFFHWPLAFPEIFDPASETPGFDVVVGNPPWNEVTIEELGFYALHDPGLRGLQTEQQRQARIARLLERFPELRDELELRKEEVAKLRTFFGPENGYELQGGGDTDVYQLFSERYTALCRPGGRLGVVLPRSAFLTEGARGFRRWLFRNCKIERLDFLLNRRSWAFPIHPQYTIALLSAQRTPPARGAWFRTSGPSASAQEFAAARQAEGVPIAADDLARWTPAPVGDPSSEPSWEVPLLPSSGAARIFDKMRAGPRFDQWAIAHGGVFPVTEFHETQQKKYFLHKSGTPVWKGQSFNQYDPHGQGLAGYADWDEALAFVQGKRTSSRSSFRGRFPPAVLADPSTHAVWKARLAFRDVSRATDSRTVRACLVPPRAFLTNKAPYLVFPSDGMTETSYVLGVLNSLPFDWQARRIVEATLNFFILALFCLPPPDGTDIDGVAQRAARLSCVDERFTEFAREAGVDCGPLDRDQRDAVRAEIDALVAHAYGLDEDELEVIFSDFTAQAVPAAYRDLVRSKFMELAPRRT